MPLRIEITLIMNFFSPTDKVPTAIKLEEGGGGGGFKDRKVDV